VTRKDLSEVRGVEVADVYKAGMWAAQLRRGPTGVEFVYQPNYEGAPVATTLPLDAAPRVTPAGAVPPFFAGLLPEGRRLTSLRRTVKTSADDELSLLLAVGTDTIGDVVVVPEGETPSEAESVVTVDADFSEVRFADVLVDAGVVDAVGLPGVQDKVSARVISMPIASGGGRSILKLDPPEYPSLVANEAYFAQVARRCGLEVADMTVVRDADGHEGLLVRRFDRTITAEGTVDALACEDACQLLDLWPADKYNTTSEAMTRALIEVCAARPVAARDVFRQFVVAWATGNGDVHAKNISVLQAEGEWQVSPAYDMPSTVFYADTTMALPLEGTTVGISRRRLLDFAESIRLPERAATRVIDDVLSGTEHVVDELRGGALPFTDRQIRDAGRVLAYRRRQLMG
jgi:serine/threonine-protein kinase HipA